MNEEEYRRKLREWISQNAPKNLMGKKILFDTVEIENYEELKNWQRKLYEAGYLGITWPKEYGGQGLDPIYEIIAYEEFIRAGLPYGRSLGSIGLMVAGPAILKHGNEEQKKKYLKRILSAEDIWCQGFSEPQAGSDLANIKTRAEDRGDYLEINGQKIWSSYAHLADYMLLLARTGEDKYKGLTMLIVNMKQEGIKVSPITQITGKSEFNVVYLNSVKVPKENIVGKVGEGWSVAMTVLNHERFFLGVTMLFVSKMLLEKLRVKELEEEIKGLEAFYKRLLIKIRRGEEIDVEGAVLKLVSSEILQRIYEIAVSQYDLETIMEDNWYLGMLASRGRTIAGGTSEILRNLIGERLLKLPK
ncbi:acyl-CoA dehydrogenase family protein [Sulfurisphaera ohwakuensis]|uniref:Acyl-CoA dehydrogenase n=1 Tax=Sulfurisphaera ohwakuensis TaxID=69656 RepID=A0A650CKS4_SULOH|nr:acyl-CoA dehydrogenase family protein [Sulfurisphaera ohwakuensis]MBB5253694.1 alkylation response protein AidB-like acyl-CoA dehydrogenase [Sulfurisphaera ohwakuensis]QGR18323.1 acyl-CoA dehydrogenase [Sulfurisphaera ohwakuensis]